MRSPFSYGFHMIFMGAPPYYSIVLFIIRDWIQTPPSDPNGVDPKEVWKSVYFGPGA